MTAPLELPPLHQIADYGYSMKEMEAYARTARCLALEAAARECERLSQEKTYQRDSQGACDDCAAAIREMAKGIEP